MIVADTNIIAYFYISSELTPIVERLVAKEPHWAAPTLWRSELRSVLALYLRKKLITFDDAYSIQTKAEAQLAGNEYSLDSHIVLQLADQSGCTAYDCEFVALAQQLGLPFITTDKKLLRAFPAIAVSLAAATA